MKQTKQGSANQNRIGGREFPLDIEQSLRLLQETGDRSGQR